MKRILTTLALIAWAGAATAVEMGDDGLHKAPWQHDTFKDLREDLAEATAEGKRLLIMVEQRGCLYCREMHEKVFTLENIEAMLNDDYYVIQINMFGDVEVTDFDGKVLTEKQAANRWGLLFTPTLMFFPAEVPDGLTAQQAAVAVMPGAFSGSTTFDLFSWVKDEGYLGDENFQKYHARMITERAN